MNEQSRKTVAEFLYNKLEEQMIDLYCRWQDESEYEDINDYGQAIAPVIANSGGEFIKMTAQPFGFFFKLGGAIYQVSLKRTRHGTLYSYRRTA